MKTALIDQVRYEYCQAATGGYGYDIVYIMLAGLIAGMAAALAREAVITSYIIDLY